MKIYYRRFVILTKNYIITFKNELKNSIPTEIIDIRQI
jgi:hypothetical protein